MKSGSGNRRDFLSGALTAWSALVVAPVLAVVGRFATPPKDEALVRESLKVASIDDIAANSAKIVRFNKDPVIVVHTVGGQFKAFSARCTHLGCIVEYKTEGGTPGFECHCHGSRFDISGKNISGPAPSPLTPLRVSLDSSAIVVTKV